MRGSVWLWLGRGGRGKNWLEVIAWGGEAGHEGAFGGRVDNITYQLDVEVKGRGDAQVSGWDISI